MRFVVRPSIVLVVFWFNSAAAQEGYLGHDHDKWHRGFYQTLLRPGSRFISEPSWLRRRGVHLHDTADDSAIRQHIVVVIVPLAR